VIGGWWKIGNNSRLLTSDGSCTIVGLTKIVTVFQRAQTNTRIFSEKPSMPYPTISDLSVDELKTLIREVVQQTIMDLFSDPDQGLGLQEDVKDFLQDSVLSYRRGARPTISAHQVAENIDLEI
jgi:hypothetical protein